MHRPLIFSASLVLLLSLLSCSQQPEDDSSQLKEPEQKALNLHVPSPDWQDQVIYFVFTDRFNDGNPDNNDQGAGEYNPQKSSHFSGGDIQGVINQLDYLKELGVTSVWMTPVVENQWWSSANNYGGYHGYWATHFGRIDPHFGDLETYQQLSHELHERDMYLIKDIVVNHTGNFFNYRGGQAGYNPDDTAENFYFLEEFDSIQPRPVQPPFDMIDRNNPEHVAAGIYNWTPTITDYRNQDHQFRYQLATLADLNTTNPKVIDAFKQIYGDWIANAGVDAFRIDTVRYVEEEFFHHFMHDTDGIHARAKATGRDHFLAFGEVFETSDAYQNDAEKSVASYLGSTEKPALNSLISFPLYRELHSVFGQGFATGQLAWRIEQHMTQYPNPFVMPTFIDNHDMARFLANGNRAGLKQALATILTIPGIPTIYQGTEQAMDETRQAMFKGGFNAKQDMFDADSDMFRFIQQLIKLRTSDKVFTRGDLNMIASEEESAGLLAYSRRYQGREVLVMLNTANNKILVDKLKLADGAKKLVPLFTNDADSNREFNINPEGLLTTELPARGIFVFELEEAVEQQAQAGKQLTISTEVSGQTQTNDVQLSGTSDFANEQIRIVKNRNLDSAAMVNTDGEGSWQYIYPVQNLGLETVTLQAYHPASGSVSNTLSFATEVSTPQLSLGFDEVEKDDHGLDGNTQPPQHVQSIGQMDIVNAQVDVGGEVLTLTLTMRELTDEWIPTNGFDNTAFSIFFATDNEQGIAELPLLNASMPDGLNWNMAHVVFGWGNSTYGINDASVDAQGEKFGVAPVVNVSKQEKQIRFTYRASDFGIASWQNAKIYVTTWDITGEGMYRKIAVTANDWDFSGPDPKNRAKILDSALLTVSAK